MGRMVQHHCDSLYVVAIVTELTVVLQLPYLGYVVVEVRRS